MDAELRGIYPIVYTPFDEAGEIDEEDLLRLVEHLIAAGAHGLAGVGGFSECHKLTTEERKRLTDLTIAAAGGRVPVMIGTSAENTKTAVELSRYADKAGAVAIFLTPPTHGTLDAIAIRRHFQAVAGAVGLPVMIQHSSIPISAAQMVDLARDFPNIRYVKEESPRSGHLITELVARSEGRLQVFSGGTYLLDELARGAVGAIPGSVCVADLARAFALLVQGENQAARAAYHHCLPLLYARRQAPILMAKEVLRRQGVFKRALLREPAGERMDAQDLAELAAVLEAMRPPY